MATLAQFSRNIRSRGSQIENSATRVVKATAKRALKSLVFNTKVDKGVARSNWRVGIGAPTRSVIEAYAPHPKGSKGSGRGIGETANATATIAAGNARIDSVRGKSGVGLTTSIYISNHVPYLDRAMIAGAVETSLLEARSEIKGFKVFRR